MCGSESSKMTSIRIRPAYEDNKTYPILTRMGGGSYAIVEMLGRLVNEHNAKVDSYAVPSYTYCYRHVHCSLPSIF